MKSTILLTLVCLCFSFALSQRSPYAGLRPASPTNQDTANRNNPGGSSDPESSSQQPVSTSSLPPPPAELPYQVGGDINYYNSLISLPKDQQPFWLLNHQHFINHRNQPDLQSSPFAQQSHFAG